MGQTLPYISIYKGDFLRGHVAACSIAAQGLWFRIMILMHDSERAGYLCLNGLPIPSKIAAAKCAVPVDEYEALLAELMSVSAFSTSREGIIFSPQIVAEADARASNAERQRRFKEKQKGNAPVTPKVTPESHPSSSSVSFSTSKKNISKENSSKPSAHPAIQAIRKVTGKFPDKELFETITTALGDNPDIPRLADCFRTWRLKGWNPVNYAWALEWYVDGIPEKYRNGSNQKQTDRSGNSAKTRSSAEYDDSRFTGVKPRF